jgi:hypothetical protein
MPGSTQCIRLLARAFSQRELDLLIGEKEFAQAYGKMNSVRESDAVIRMGGVIMQKQWFVSEMARRKKLFI